MLIFFIHGVATSDIKYADRLKVLIKEELSKRGKALPNFYSSFWGNALGDVDKMWGWIDRDLKSIHQESIEIDIDDCLRYRKYREGFLSAFVGDTFTYLNKQRGFEIRKLIAQQLAQFLKHHPQQTELHIITHSLGSVILWDIFFSERFERHDPAFDIRTLIHNLSSQTKQRQVYLKSITTMGSPILFFNTMLEVNPSKVKEFAKKCQGYSLKWLNVIHSSDLIAYPLKSSLLLDLSDNLQLTDVYIDTNSNFASRTARLIGQDIAAMALDVENAHSRYWNCSRTAQLIVDNFQNEGKNQLSKSKDIQKVIDCLKITPGMSVDILKLHINDEPDTVLNLLDGTGKLFYVVSAAKIHCVYLFDEMNICRFSGYVGWLHIKDLKNTIKLIENCWC